MLFLQGVMIIALLNLSTTMNSELNPWDVGKSVIKSIIIISQMFSRVSLHFKGMGLQG